MAIGSVAASGQYVPEHTHDLPEHRHDPIGEPGEPNYAIKWTPESSAAFGGGGGLAVGLLGGAMPFGAGDLRGRTWAAASVGAGLIGASIGWLAGR